jgi:hypothetical protein
VWAALFALAYAVAAYRRNGVSASPTPSRPNADTPIRTIWPLGAWGLHILCDIPTHSTRFFPTPYLWPLPTPFVNGMPWARGWFMLTNYACIGLTYLIIFLTAVPAAPSDR